MSQKDASLARQAVTESPKGPNDSNEECIWGKTVSYSITLTRTRTKKLFKFLIIRLLNYQISGTGFNNSLIN